MLTYHHRCQSRGRIRGAQPGSSPPAAAPPSPPPTRGAASPGPGGRRGSRRGRRRGPGRSDAAPQGPPEPHAPPAPRSRRRRAPVSEAGACGQGGVSACIWQGGPAQIATAKRRLNERNKRHLDLHGGAAAERGVVRGADGAILVHGGACGPPEPARVRCARVCSPKVRLARMGARM